MKGTSSTAKASALLLFLISFGFSSVSAAEPSMAPASDPSGQVGMASEDEGIKRVRNTIKVLLPSLQVDGISASPIPGLYEVTFGSQLFYMSGDGKYLMQGEITDLMTRKPVTEIRLKELKKAAVERIDEADMIIYGDDDLPYQITVFTDIDCGYCRKMHSQMAEYNRRGIRVRYLAYPRAGINSASYRDAVSVWCADDPKEAMTRAKGGEKLPAKTCDNPVRAQFELGQDFGIRGTPALVLDNGEVIPGYVKPAPLQAALQKSLN